MKSIYWLRNGVETIDDKLVGTSASRVLKRAHLRTLYATAITDGNRTDIGSQSLTCTLVTLVSRAEWWSPDGRYLKRPVASCALVTRVSRAERGVVTDDEWHRTSGFSRAPDLRVLGGSEVLTADGIVGAPDAHGWARMAGIGLFHLRHARLDPCAIWRVGRRRSNRGISR